MLLICAIGAYYLCLLLLTVYGIHRFWLMVSAHNLGDPPPPLRPDRWPTVTVQLPLYNEATVAARLLQGVAAMEYPYEVFEVQVLDDSTDGTSIIVDREVASMRARGIDVSVLRRKRRESYKAGALAAGLTRAKGEFIAIFDADFVPPPNFLTRVLPFMSAEIGMVQARWGFFEPRRTWLSRAQTVLLGGHFAIEHAVRASLGYWFNFNGTAGIWRKQAIVEAGGWQGDTLTEDLDLSYRAQLAGWRFAYLNQVIVPSELPGHLNDFIQQQERWARGGIQTARKLLGRI